MLGGNQCCSPPVNPFLFSRYHLLPYPMSVHVLFFTSFTDWFYTRKPRISPLSLAFLIILVRRWYAPAHVQKSPIYCECKLMAFPRILFSLSLPRPILATYTAGEKIPNFACDPIWRELRLFDRATGCVTALGRCETTKLEPFMGLLCWKCEMSVAIIKQNHTWHFPWKPIPLV